MKISICSTLLDLKIQRIIVLSAVQERFGNPILHISSLKQMVDQSWR